MGTKLGGLVCLGGCLAPPCVQCLDPKEPKSSTDGVRVKWLSYFPPTACGQREARGAGSGVDAGPSADHLGCLPSPGGNTLARTSCLERDGWKQCPRSPNCLHQGDGSSCPSCWVFGQRAFPLDLVPRPEALTDSLKKTTTKKQIFTALLKIAWAPEETLQGQF